MIAKLTRLAAGHPRPVLAGAVATLLLAAGFGLPVTNSLRSGRADFQSSTTQYERANAQLQRANGQTPYDGLIALITGPRPIASDPALATAARRVAKLLAKQPGFQRGLDYPSTDLSSLLSRDRRETAVLAAFTTPEAAGAAAKQLGRELKHGLPPHIQVAFGGPDVVFNELDQRTINDLKRAEMIAFPIILLLSLWIFRGLIAALLPALVGGMAILITLAGLRLVDQLTPVSVFALNLTTGIGLGLGVDYSLFVVSRFREELAGGAEVPEALRRTLATAGQTVLFSSLTVAAAMTSLLLFPTRFLNSMGISGVFVALADGGVALLVLPALLALLGTRINALSPRLLSGRAGAAHPGRGLWPALVRTLMRHPGITAIAASLALLAAAAPALTLKLVAPGSELLPSGAPARQVEERLTRDFAFSQSQATLIVVTARRVTATPGNGGGESAAVRHVVSLAADVAGGRAVQGPARYVGRRTWEIMLAAKHDAFNVANLEVVRALRRTLAPTGALVAGAGAYFLDQQSSIASGVLPAGILLLALTTSFLFLMTRSAILPAKAFLMNLLTACIGIGLLVAIFQDGLLNAIPGLNTTGGLEESNLVLLIVITFALSTDYEVFLLARIKEAWDGGAGNAAAVATGLERTGRLITAAALLFCVAVGALATSEVFVAQQLGIGAALAVAIDASAVRALLVPSLMALLGRWNWWAPKPLRRLHARLSFLVAEGAA